MNTKRNRSHFRSGSGCYTCRNCGKLTRETGACESGCELCLLCYTAAGLGNTLSDSGAAGKLGIDPWDYLAAAKTVEEVNRLFSDAVKRAGMEGQV